MNSTMNENENCCNKSFFIYFFAFYCALFVVLLRIAKMLMHDRRWMGYAHTHTCIHFQLHFTEMNSKLIWWSGFRKCFVRTYVNINITSYICFVLFCCKNYKFLEWKTKVLYEYQYGKQSVENYNEISISFVFVLFIFITYDACFNYNSAEKYVVVRVDNYDYYYYYENMSFVMWFNSVMRIENEDEICMNQILIINAFYLS